MPTPPPDAPTDAELHEVAAAVVLLLRPRPAPAEAPAPQSHWHDRSALLHVKPAARPGGWRASALPR
jgi:hypothetical protein